MSCKYFLNLRGNGLVVGTGPVFQMRKLGSERLNSLPKVTQLIDSKAKSWDHVRLPSKPGCALFPPQHFIDLQKCHVGNDLGGYLGEPPK